MDRKPKQHTGFRAALSELDEIGEAIQGGAITKQYLAKAEAAQLQTKEKLQGDGPPCLHPSLRLGKSDQGFLKWTCRDCGEAVRRPSQRPSPGG